MTHWPLLRGQVVRAKLAHIDEPKLFVVVSNNDRNRSLGQVLTVRLTTSSKPAIPSVVELGHPEVFVGRACCDDVVEVYEDEVLAVLGGLTANGMKAVDNGLRAAFALG